MPPELSTVNSDAADLAPTRLGRSRAGGVLAYPPRSSIALVGSIPEAEKPPVLPMPRSKPALVPSCSKVHFVLLAHLTQSHRATTIKSPATSPRPPGIVPQHAILASVKLLDRDDASYGGVLAVCCLGVGPDPFHHRASFFFLSRVLIEPLLPDQAHAGCLSASCTTHQGAAVRHIPPSLVGLGFPPSGQLPEV